MEKKKSKAIEFNFVTFIIILVILLAIVFVIARKTGGNIPEQIENIIEQTQEKTEPKESKPYSKDVITIDEGALTDNWQIIDKSYGSILFYVQGPKNENEDGTFSDIRVNLYLQKSGMTNEELKKQMLEDSVYQEIEYTKMQEINSIQWMEFEAENKGVKAKILAIMKDGYMYAIEINGEENLYNQYYNEAMKIAMTTQIAERINTDAATEVIYKYDSIANIKTGGTQYLITSLKLPVTEEASNQNLPEEYKEYVWTGIKYSDFENEMKKYMTEEVLKNQFSEFINYNGLLYYKNVTGTQYDYMIEETNIVEVKGNETTYELVKMNMNTYETVKQKLTLKLENGNCVVSNVE